MLRASAILLLGAACSAEVFYKETFDATYGDRWVGADREGLGKFVRAAGPFVGDAEINQGLKTSEDAKFYGIASKLSKPFTNKDKPLVVSFSVQHGQVCLSDADAASTQSHNHTTGHRLRWRLREGDAGDGAEGVQRRLRVLHDVRPGHLRRHEEDPPDLQLQGTVMRLRVTPTHGIIKTH